MKDMLKVVSINTALLFGVIFGLRPFRAREMWVGGVAVHANKQISHATTVHFHVNSYPRI